MGIVVNRALLAGWENLWQRDLRSAQDLRLYGYANVQLGAHRLDTHGMHD